MARDSHCVRKPCGKPMAQRLAELIHSVGAPVVVYKYGQVGVDDLWRYFDAVILIMALSGAVRVICNSGKAPNKGALSLVLVVNDTGNYVIPLLNAHYGANELALELAHMLNAEAVITTATENLGLTSIEELARELNCEIVNPELLPRVYDSLLRGEAICVSGVDRLLSNVRGNYEETTAVGIIIAVIVVLLIITVTEHLFKHQGIGAQRL
ncbi:hypothetical protein [Vulcanisaeta thermophila]|uniref:hypothetical protein n=1 Tax=Vulcanisaeta thermophila TaxID=867917 RepID=UPI000853B47A|nr:hypothetical protein [Vulcanisaeta thermophila]